jgi:hypothetical protein
VWKTSADKLIEGKTSRAFKRSRPAGASHYSAPSEIEERFHSLEVSQVSHASHLAFHPGQGPYASRFQIVISCCASRFQFGHPGSWICASRFQSG